jgi:hypothetical protein
MGFMDTLAPIIELSVVYVLLFTTGRSPTRAERTKRGRATVRRGGYPAPRIRLSLLPPSPLTSLTAPKRNAGAFPDEGLDFRAARMKENP